jgi:hypothetical protein
MAPPARHSNIRRTTLFTNKISRHYLIRKDSALSLQENNTKLSYLGSDSYIFFICPLQAFEEMGSQTFPVYPRLAKANYDRLSGLLS